MMLLPRLAALALALIACAPLTADAKWTQLRTRNFLFIGDASEGDIRRHAEKLEQFREIFGRVLPATARPSPVPTVVIVFATDRSFEPYKPHFDGRAIEVNGYFQPGDDVNYIAVVAQDGAALRTIFHEYTHFLINNAAQAVPAWLNEGLAEVYSTFEGRSDGRGATIGLAPTEHVELLRNSKPMPLRELLAVTHASPVYNEGNRRGVFYAESWALVHYLMYGSPARGNQLGQYFAALRNGVPADQAFVSVFGDSRILEQELASYLGVTRQVFPAVGFKFSEPVGIMPATRGVPLDEADALGYLGDLLARLDRAADARRLLEDVLKQHPTSVRTEVSLGLLDLRENELAAAVPRLRDAAARAQTDAAAQAAYGRALVIQMQDLLNDREALRPLLPLARSTLTRAADADPDAVAPIALLGYVELIDGSDPERAATLLDRAARLAPVREHYQLLAGEAWLRQREFTHATDYFGPLMAHGSTAEIRAAARDGLAAAAELRSPRPSPARDGSPATAAAGSIASLDTPTTGALPTRPTLAILEADGRLTEIRPEKPGQEILSLRQTLPGETRVFGMFSAAECAADAVVLRIDANGHSLRLVARRFDDIDFVTYASSTPGSIPCGVFAAPSRVLATFRPRPASAGGFDGDAVAIELLPEGYQPKD
jgi:tetratricopeptide (TPR) repeat protein